MPARVGDSGVWRCATLNVRTLKPGDAAQLAEELDRIKVGVCGLQEVRKPGMGIRRLGGSTWTLAHSGHATQCVAGVGALMSPWMRRALRHWAPCPTLPDRLLRLTFALRGGA